MLNFFQSLIKNSIQFLSTEMFDEILWRRKIFNDGAWRIFLESLYTSNKFTMSFKLILRIISRDSECFYTFLSKFTNESRNVSVIETYLNLIKKPRLSKFLVKNGNIKYIRINFWKKTSFISFFLFF